MTGRGKPPPFRPNFAPATPAGGTPPPDRGRDEPARQAAIAGRRCHWCGAPGQTGRCRYCKTWPEMDLAPPILTVPAGTDDAVLADLLDACTRPAPLVLTEACTFTPFSRPAAPSRPNPGDRRRQ